MSGAIAAGVGGAVLGSVVSGAINGGGGGGGGGGGNSIGQGVGNILAGGLSSALGIQGLTVTNANQLQAGAAAANPFGGQSNQYYPALQAILGGGLVNQIGANTNTQLDLLRALEGTANISTNIGSLSQQGNISTPGQTGLMQQLLNNPTQLLSTLQGGGVGLPSGISSILSQNPYELTSGQQFQMQQGQQNLDRSLAQTGQIGSGNQYVAAEQYGQQFASQAIQQNISNLLGAQSSANQTSSTNQGLQGILNQMGQNQFANAGSLSQLLSGQQQSSFNNQLSTQQLQSSQQQNSQANLQNLLTQLMGIQNQGVGQIQGLIPGLLTATQASGSSPATAGGILANLGVANQASGQNVASGLAGLGQGGAFVDTSTGYSGGGNSYGFTM